jgi:hypothetical protein
MKRIASFLAGISFALMLNSNAATIGFDDLANPTVPVTTQYSALGVVFSTSWVAPRTGTPDPLGYPDYLGLGGVGFHSYCNAPEYVQANFSIAVSTVQIQIQPFEGGTFTYGLQAFDAAGTLLGAALYTAESHSSWSSVALSDQVGLGIGLGESTIAYVRFFGYNNSGVNAVVFDNFVFSGPAVPEVASTLCLLGLALVGMSGLKKLI